jgi:predicted  nucleic acid-binding Zn-ribbon protein
MQPSFTSHSQLPGSKESLPLSDLFRQYEELQAALPWQKLEYQNVLLKAEKLARKIENSRLRISEAETRLKSIQYEKGSILDKEWYQALCQTCAPTKNKRRKRKILFWKIASSHIMRF